VLVQLKVSIMRLLLSICRLELVSPTIKTSPRDLTNMPRLIVS
jgi:hypothetical protein